jgi:hypothetical protein
MFTLAARDVVHLPTTGRECSGVLASHAKEQLFQISLEQARNGGAGALEEDARLTARLPSHPRSLQEPWLRH